MYEELTRSARDVARAGYVAIVDAVFAADTLRRAVHDAASREGVSFVGLWLDAPIEIMEARLAARGIDASDATADVLRQQQARAMVPNDWRPLDASGSLDQVAEAARASAAESIQAISDIHQPIH